VTTIIPSKRTTQMLSGLTCLATCLALGTAICSAQIGRAPTPIRPKSAPYSFPLTATTQRVPGPAGKPITVVNFGVVPLGLVSVQTVSVNVAAANPIVNIDIKDNNGADPSPLFKSEKNTSDDPCSAKAPAESNPAGTCTIAVGFSPADDHASVTATLTIEFLNGVPETFNLNGTGGSSACIPPKHTFLPLNVGFKEAELYPILPKSTPDKLAQAIYKDFGDPIRKTVVNCFYSTNGLFSYFNQFQSIYSAASGSTTLNAQLGSLNFTNGMQVTVGTNPQVGPTTSTSTTTSSSALAASVPTLSATAAAQAAQNVLSGGTIFGYDLFPLLYHQSNGLVTLSAVGREGVDIQKFNNMSITATNPSSHTFVGLQGYLQYNSSNNAANSTDPAGSIFVGGSYGYSLMNHSYSVENGFGGRVNSQIAQLSAGILINGVVRLAAYRGFGPSQRYIDSTTMAQKTVNNFQTWSVAIAYQSSGKSK
jgi:hypothetical protein